MRKPSSSRIFCVITSYTLGRLRKGDAKAWEFHGSAITGALNSRRRTESLSELERSVPVLTRVRNRLPSVQGLQRGRRISEQP